MSRTTLSLREALLVSAICFGPFIYWSTQAVLSGFPEARFTDAGNVWAIAVEMVLAGIALLYLRARDFDLAALYPAPGIPGTFLGLAIFFGAWLVGAIVVAPFENSMDAMMTPFSFSGVSLTTVILFAMVNGAYEEVFLLGVLVRGLRGYGLSVAVGLPLLVRVLYHLYQGPLGALWVLAAGLMFTLFYIRSRQLWPPVLAHILWDIVPVLLAGR